MLPPIQIKVVLNAPVKCARSECNHLIDNAIEAVFVARHVMVVAYCCPSCYLLAWQSQIERREEALEALGYYNE